MILGRSNCAAMGGCTTEAYLVGRGGLGTAIPRYAPERKRLLKKLVQRYSLSVTELATPTFTAGLLIIAAVEEMLPETHESGEDTHISIIALWEDLPCSLWYQRVWKGYCRRAETSYGWCCINVQLSARILL